MYPGDVEIALALAALDGDWTEEAIALRLAAALGEKPRRWMRALAKRLATAARPAHDEAARLIAAHESSAEARGSARVRRWFMPRQTMRPSRFSAPPISSLRDTSAGASSGSRTSIPSEEPG